MPLVPNASRDEYSSPFFVRNKEFCENYEKFIISLNGRITGKYNAFSFNVIGEISKNIDWIFRIKKSTFNSSGNLILSSESQCLFTASQWSSKGLNSNCPKFIIKRKSNFDFLRMFLFSNWKNIRGLEKYIIKCDDPKNILISKLNMILLKLYKEEKVFKVCYDKSEIFIDLRTDQIHKKEIMDLLKLKTMHNS